MRESKPSALFSVSKRDLDFFIHRNRSRRIVEQIQIRQLRAQQIRRRQAAVRILRRDPRHLDRIVDQTSRSIFCEISDVEADAELLPRNNRKPKRFSPAWLIFSTSPIRTVTKNDSLSTITDVALRCAFAFSDRENIAAQVLDSVPVVP